jgi:hypothetical protein
MGMSIVAENVRVDRCGIYHLTANGTARVSSATLCPGQKKRNRPNQATMMMGSLTKNVRCRGSRNDFQESVT